MAKFKPVLSKQRGKPERSKLIHPIDVPRNGFTPTGRGKGRPEHEPTAATRQMVEVLSGFAINRENISAVLGITIPTLAKHYAEELKNGTAKVETKLISNLLTIASGRDAVALRAICFALQTRFGWSAYVPRPERESEKETAPILGKKEQALLDAKTAHLDSEWGSLVN